MVVKIDDPHRRSADDVKAVLAGKSGVLPLPAAVALVAELDVPVGEREELLGRVVSSADDATARTAAAVGLRRLATPGARERLAASLSRESEGRVAADIALALGFVGSEDDVEPLLKKGGAVAEPFARERIRFAAALLAHRLGLSKPQLPFPPLESRLGVGDKTVALRARSPESAEAEAALEALRADPVGMDSARELVHAVECGPRTLYVALNRDVAESGLGRLGERKTLAAVIEIFYEAHGRASPAMLVFTAPGDSGIDVFVTRLTGEPLYRGVTRFDGDRLEGDVWGVDAIGVTPVEIHVTFERDSLSVEGASDGTVRKQRQPLRLGKA